MRARTGRVHIGQPILAVGIAVSGRLAIVPDAIRVEVEEQLHSVQAGFIGVRVGGHELGAVDCVGRTGGHFEPHRIRASPRVFGCYGDARVPV